MAGERHWRVEVEGFAPITTSELTIDEAALAEQVSGVPWTLMNPISSVRVAKALLVILLKRSRVNEGRTVEAAEAEALETAGSMPISVLHGAFTFVPGDRDLPATDRRGGWPPELGAYVREWLTWAALRLGWPPTVTRQQRIGDLFDILDATTTEGV